MALSGWMGYPPWPRNLLIRQLFAPLYNLLFMLDICLHNLQNIWVAWMGSPHRRMLQGVG